MDNEKINLDYIPISLTINDIPEIKNLCYYFWEEEGIYSENYYELILEQNLSYIFRDNDILTAVCLAEYEEEEKKVCIAVLCVKAEYQRKGLGKLILNHCINNCVQKGYNDFYLHVCVTNYGAIKLYEKLGFYKKEVIKNYYYDSPPPNNDAYKMVLNKNKKNEIKKRKNENNNEFNICFSANLSLIIIIGIIIGIEFIIIFSN